MRIYGLSTLLILSLGPFLAFGQGKAKSLGTHLTILLSRTAVGKPGGTEIIFGFLGVHWEVDKDRLTFQKKEKKTD